MNGLHHVAFYPSDWLAGTRGLTAAETGVYITLIAMMYERGEALAYEPQRLARMCGLPKAGFMKASHALCEQGKISISDGLVWNERVEKEISAALNRIEKTSSLAREKANARWQKNKQNQRAVDAVAMPQECQLEPEPDIISSKEDICAKSRFDEFWDVYAHKKARPKCEAIWKRKKLDDIADVVIDGAMRYRDSRGPDPGFWKHPQGWLNDERWTDDVTPQIHSQSNQPKKPTRRMQAIEDFLNEPETSDFSDSRLISTTSRD